MSRRATANACRVTFVAHRHRTGRIGCPDVTCIGQQWSHPRSLVVFEVIRATRFPGVWALGEGNFYEFTHSDRQGRSPHPFGAVVRTVFCLKSWQAGLQGFANTAVDFELRHKRIL